MSQRLKACCCGDCINGALGACCYKRGGGGGGASTCECSENLTECACKNIGGVWNGSNNCATGCLGSCCLVENSSGRILSCQDNVTECDCALVTNATQTGFWMVGVGCYNNPCGIPCGPKLCLEPQGGYIRETHTQTYNETSKSSPNGNGEINSYTVVTDNFRFVYYIYHKDVVASLAILLTNPIYQSPRITVVNDSWVTSRRVETWTVSIAETTGDCIKMGCRQNESYSQRTLDGYNGESDCSQGYSYTSESTGQSFYATINPCIANYPNQTGPWFWLDRFGNQACRILGDCELQLVEYNIRSRLGYPGNGCGEAPTIIYTNTSYNTCP